MVPRNIYLGSVCAQREVQHVESYKITYKCIPGIFNVGVIV